MNKNEIRLSLNDQSAPSESSERGCTAANQLPLHLGTDIAYMTPQRQLTANLAYHTWLRRFIHAYQRNIIAENKYPEWRQIQWEKL